MAERDLAGIVVGLVGELIATGDEWNPYDLVDRNGVLVEPVAVYLRDLQAMGRRPTTLRSYGMDLLRWFRFLWAIDVSWDRATRAEARDFCRWIQLTDKPVRGRARRGAPLAGTPNPVTGKPAPGVKYAISTVLHSETVLRRFYDFHRDGGDGPLLNPFPPADSRRGRRGAHRSPMLPRQVGRAGLYRPTMPVRVPRSIPDDLFNRLFATLGSNRDRALVAFWVSTGARASELLGACRRDADVSEQLISVVRKGTRQIQALPASADAFVWLSLYQHEMRERGVPVGMQQPLWWTLRSPFRPLNYHAARRAFDRANAVLGSNWTLHDLRHTAAYRMAEDPHLSLTDVQWVLGHAHLTTTQLYLNARPEEVIRHLRAHHERQTQERVTPTAPKDGGYGPGVLATLFGVNS